jgi:hypothetical protein
MMHDATLSSRHCFVASLLAMTAPFKAFDLIDESVVAQIG